MSQVDKSAIHDFTTGETVTEAMLDQNTEVLRVAHNDTDNRVIVLENAQAGAMTGIRSGTAFPTSPVPKAGDKFYRTDQHMEYIYTEASQWEELSYSKSESDAKFVSAAGEHMEIIEITFSPNGSSNLVTANATFSKTYTAVPTIAPANPTAITAYGDAQLYPYIFNITTTGFSARLAAVGGNFGAGTIKMKFIVIGK